MFITTEHIKHIKTGIRTAINKGIQTGIIRESIYKHKHLSVIDEFCKHCIARSRISKNKELCMVLIFCNGSIKKYKTVFYKAGLYFGSIRRNAKSGSCIDVYGDIAKVQIVIKNNNTK